MRLLFAFIFLLPYLVQAQMALPDTGNKTMVYRLFSKQVGLVKYTYGQEHPRFLVLHDDENTGVAAAGRYIGIYGGSLLALEYGGMRNITFGDTMNTYEIDPNNIFTEPGARKGLDRTPAGLVTPEATSALLGFGREVLAFYSGKNIPYIITLHNNGEGNFTVCSYLPGASRQHDAGAVHVSSYMDEDDMVIVTDMRFFTYLKEKDINVVYQSETGTDDGSLSVYAMQNKIPYLNIEVQHGHLETQAMLIAEISAMLKGMKIIPAPLAK